MASVTLEQVSKIYKEKGKAGNKAVKSVDLAIHDGEIISLLGSSGCGKTSTLRMIAGFESVSEGTIRIGSRVVNDLKPAERSVAMAFEGYALYPPLTVADNIGFSLLRGRMPRADVRRRVQHVAELLEIVDILDSYPPTLSGGQQQRVSLARALVRPADLYLLDEPMSQLEPQLRAVLRGRIKEYLIEHRMTSVFVTHDQTEAVALSDRIAVMSNGMLQQFASPADLKERPANLFVAGFIGEPAMNLLPARLTLAGGLLQAVVMTDDGVGEALRVSFGPLARVARAATLHEGQAVHLGVRSHKIAFGGTPACDNTVRGTLAFNQWQGDQSHLGVDVGGHTLLVVTDGALDIDDGAPVDLCLPLAALHLFDSASETALVHGTELR
ncbi:ABC transporter ATP-binding protein (plasmid) [Burkholderia humptydooensis]|uniref:ABC transporter ATP-binding protein n=2 Tax=Burkholderia humptydooensis TaxID=430531 RepID=A0A7U4P7W3_9BURK|nr:MULTISPECIES: ABC transporter ATP-binding protein [Burkholderia]AJY38046.1 ABC transporter family protein [Burkholderia sp. 2002721687]ALX44614.1 ABC transporter ATP-binding protein [Burkholderia humptydooensis]EIP84963.1 ABC transporter related protein [Burkholderia humptydooensis MSMB43]QPS42005.1 ABC transporter ATP-binding protein [Burkholderia humptydooensis]